MSGEGGVSRPLVPAHRSHVTVRPRLGRVRCICMSACAGPVCLPRACGSTADLPANHILAYLGGSRRPPPYDIHTLHIDIAHARRKETLAIRSRGRSRYILTRRTGGRVGAPIHSRMRQQLLVRLRRAPCSDAYMHAPSRAAHKRRRAPRGHQRGAARSSVGSRGGQHNDRERDAERPPRLRSRLL